MNSGGRRYRPRSGSKDREFLATIAGEDLAALRARLVKLVKSNDPPEWRIVAVERAIARALDRQES